MRKRHRELLKNSAEIKRRRLRRRFYFGLAVVLIFLAALFLVAHWDSLLIDKIIVQGEETVRAEELINSSQKTLAGNYWWIFPKRHIWWYSPTKIIADLRVAYPQLSAIKISRLNNRTLQLSVTERRARYLWCVEKENCYFADQTGFIFSRASTFSNHPFFIFAIPVSGNPIGQQPLSLENFVRLLHWREALMTALKKSTLFADVEIFQVAPRSGLEFALAATWPTAKSRPDFSLLIDLAQEIDPAVRNLLSVAKTTAFVADVQAANFAIDYLDLKFPPKVFYRLY